MSLWLTRSERAALKRVWPLLQVNRAGFAAACVLGALGLGASVGLGAVSAWLIARASQMPPILYLNIAVTSVRFFGISKALLRYLERLSSHRVAVAGMSSLRTNIYVQAARQPAARIAALRRGDLLARTGADVDAVGELVVKSLLPAAVMALVGIGSVAGLALLDPASAGVLLVCLLLAGVCVPLLALRASRIAEHANLAASAGLSEACLRILEHGGELAISGRQGDALRAVTHYEDVLRAARSRQARPAAWAAAVDVASMLAAVIGATWFGIHGVAGHQVSEVALAVLVLTPLAVFEGTAQLGPAAQQLVRSAAAAERIAALIGPASPAQDAAAGDTAAAASTVTAADRSAEAATGSANQTGRGSGAAAACGTRAASGRAAARGGGTVEASPAGALTRATGTAGETEARAGAASSSRTANDSARAKGSGPDATVCARGIVLGWPGGPALSCPLDITLRPGTRTAIVGRSGIGKTTLLYTLAGMIAPRAGRVTLDGRDISALPRRRVARSLTLTPEDAHVFATTLLENLRVGNGALDPAAATALLQRVGLGEWLAALPAGLDTVVGSGATTISGGERRRLLLARALASPAPLLLLDEPGEHIDPARADALVRDLLRIPTLERGRGVALVTHRLSALAAASHIIVLGRNEQGRAYVEAAGTHDELRHNCPTYRWALTAEASQ